MNFVFKVLPLGGRDHVRKFRGSGLEDLPVNSLTALTLSMSNLRSGPRDKRAIRYGAYGGWCMFVQ